MASSKSEQAEGYFLVGMLLGAAVGAALGLLYAPRPGADARRELADRSGHLYDRARERVADEDDTVVVPPPNTPL